MKLRKAMEKAQEMRDAADSGEFHQSPAVAGGGRGRADGTASAAEWTPPAYTKSRQVHLDRDSLRRNRCICYFPEAPEADSYKVLRTQIRHRARDRGWKTIMVTSPGAGEGKTLTAVNLALTFAKEFHQTVMLVDADLRRQAVHRCLGYKGETGLADYLSGLRPLSDVVVWPGVDKMTVISGGATVADSSELLASPRMQALAAEMKDRYPDRYIIFDAPPVLGCADAIAFAPLVDCILMVVEAGNTDQQAVRDAINAIPEEKFLGFVLNRGGSIGEEYDR